MTSPACAITETPPILYAVCTGLARAISTPLKTLVKSRSKRLPLVHVVYCGGSALRNFAAFLTALHRTSPAGKCRTFPVRESGKMRPKNTPEKAEKKPFIIAFNPEPKEQFRKVWKGWQFKAPKRHYRLILTPVANHVSAAPRIVGDFTKLQSALDAAIEIESPQLIGSPFSILADWPSSAMRGATRRRSNALLVSRRRSTTPARTCTALSLSKN
ncbi:hypothetical protein ELZ20_17155 [Brucella abortus]|nr:hypothetical protein ELZ20_17155 [Brucella abortus]